MIHFNEGQEIIFDNENKIITIRPILTEKIIKASNRHWYVKLIREKRKKIFFRFIKMPFQLVILPIKKILQKTKYNI